MPRDLFINTIRGVYTPKPTGRKMLILGHNGVIGGRLKTRLEEDGHEVEIVPSPTMEMLSEEFLSSVDTCYILAYDIEPIDVPIGDVAFLKRLRDLALTAGVGRLILLESIKKLESGEPVYRDVLARAEAIVTGSALPVTSFRSSILLDIELNLVRSIASYVADGTSPLLPEEAAHHECEPLLLDEAVEFMARAVDHEIPRTYYFGLGGSEKISYQHLVNLFVEREREKNDSLGISELPKRKRLASLSADAHTAWNVFLKKTSMDMVVEGDSARDYFRDVEVTPLIEAVKKA